MSSENLKNLRSIPLTPDQLPEPPEWAQSNPNDPNVERLQNSPSFQSVLKHNEDLMARLTISLRRVSHLEKHIEDLKRRLNAEKAAADGVRDEVLIQSEKMRLSDAETQKLVHLNTHKSNVIEELNIQISALEAKCENIKTLSDGKIEEMTVEHSQAMNKIVSEYELKVSNLELTISGLEKMRLETEDVIKPQFKRLKVLCEKQMDKITEMNLTQQDLNSRLVVAQKEAADATTKLVIDKKELRSELQQVKRRLLQLLKVEEKYRQSNKDRIFWENKFIALEKKHDKFVDRTSKNNKDLSEETLLKDSEIKRLKIENFEVKKSWSESRQKEKALEEKFMAADEQAQSLKHMWQDKSKRMTELESQVKIYESMRLDLSMRLKSYETEISRKNKQIDDLLKVVETMKNQGSHPHEAIIETALRGMKDLYFEEDHPPAAQDILGDKGISF